MITVANPIYDSVFKYLMEDERIARTIQTYLSPTNRHTLNLDEHEYGEHDFDMQTIIKRLLMAASSTEMRMDMNVEDEYFSLIDENEKKLYYKDQELADLHVKLDASHEQLAKSVRLLLGNGLTSEQVAASLDMDVALVERLAHEQ